MLSMLSKSDQTFVNAYPPRARVSPPGSSFRLKDNYDQYFQVMPAQTDEQIQLTFRLRYEVYCVDQAFEDPAANPGGMERDRHDDHALHSLLMHRHSGEAAGTVRLILPRLRDGAPDFPIREVCAHKLLAENNAALPWEHTAEISRFAVSKDFRRRAKEKPPIGALSTPETDPRRAIINTSLGLMQAIFTMSKNAGMRYFCAVMEPTLLRMLKRLGIYFVPLGGLVEYHGLRQPCYADIDQLLARVWSERPDVWEILSDDGRTWPLNRALTIANV